MTAISPMTPPRKECLPACTSRAAIARTPAAASLMSARTQRRPSAAPSPRSASARGAPRVPTVTCMNVLIMLTRVPAATRNAACRTRIVQASCGKQRRPWQRQARATTKTLRLICLVMMTMRTTAMMLILTTLRRRWSWGTMPLMKCCGNQTLSIFERLARGFSLQYRVIRPYFRGTKRSH